MTATLYPARRADHADIDYTARRLAVGAVAVLAVVVLAIAGSALVGALVGGTSAAASDTAAVPAPTVHVAQPGDTLWSIADQYRGDVGHGRYVDVLVDLNGGAVIQIGQAVRLP